MIIEDANEAHYDGCDDGDDDDDDGDDRRCCRLSVGGALVNRSNFQTSLIPPKFWQVVDIYDNKKA
jgi:hypothetical protein